MLVLLPDTSFEVTFGRVSSRTPATDFGQTRQPCGKTGDLSPVARTTSSCFGGVKMASSGPKPPWTREKGMEIAEKSQQDIMAPQLFSLHIV